MVYVPDLESVSNIFLRNKLIIIFFVLFTEDKIFLRVYSNKSLTSMLQHADREVRSFGNKNLHQKSSSWDSGTKLLC